MSKGAASPGFLTGEQVLANWQQDLVCGKGPAIYKHALPAPELAPERVVVLAGAPGVGKTALVMNVVVEALRGNEHLRALICNVEMSPYSLFDRQLARISGIDGEIVRHRRFTPNLANDTAVGIATLKPVWERLAFLESPFDMNRVAEVADMQNVDIIVLDYVQRIRPQFAGGDTRVNTSMVMTEARKLATAGCAVIALSAISRSKDDRGHSSYEKAGLASLRETSELEYGADDVFLLAATADFGRVRLNHLKCRHGAPLSIDLRFTPAVQSFQQLDDFAEEKPVAKRQSHSRARKPGQQASVPFEQLTALWNTNAAAASGNKRGSQC